MNHYICFDHPRSGRCAYPEGELAISAKAGGELGPAFSPFGTFDFSEGEFAVLPAPAAFFWLADSTLDFRAAVELMREKKMFTDGPFAVFPTGKGYTDGRARIQPTPEWLRKERADWQSKLQAKDELIAKLRHELKVAFAADN